MMMDPKKLMNPDMYGILEPGKSDGKDSYMAGMPDPTADTDNDAATEPDNDEDDQTHPMQHPDFLARMVASTRGY